MRGYVSAVGQRWPKVDRLIAAAAILVFATYLGVEGARGARETARRDRARLTMERVRRIGDAIDRVRTAEGVYPCIASTDLLPTSITSDLGTDGGLDAWGRRIVTVSAPSRYVIRSLGADGIWDSAQDKKTFDGFDGDVMYSNGEWLRHPSAMATRAEQTVAPSAAMREASACE